ncbi:hypothetical protein MMC25_004142 [Agyrium rufum]|nr:hypothetical protein [Agyrium rufum]
MEACPIVIRDLDQFSCTTAVDSLHYERLDQGPPERVKILQNRIPILRYLTRFEEKVDQWIGIETQGVNQIYEEDKQPPPLVNAFLMWWSMITNVGTLQIGLLGPVLGLSLRQSIGGIVIGTLLGAFCPAFAGILGRKLGLRSIATARFSFGFYGAKICSVLNIIHQAGFAVINTVLCGQLLSAMSNYKMTMTVGMIILAVTTYVVSIFGFAFIHRFEKYSWILTFIALCVLLGQTVPIMRELTTSLPDQTDTTGPFLSFIAISFSASSGWASIVADYYCNYSIKIPAWKLSLLTLLGISIPTIFTATIGSCLGILALQSGPGTYKDVYTDHGIGGLIATICHPEAWSKISMIVFMFSALGSTVVGNYSSGLAIQLLGDYFQAIPRFIWSLIVTIATTVMAIAGREELSAIVGNFLSLSGYWTVCFTVILLLEDQLFRTCRGYEYGRSRWDQPHLLPWGVGAVAALLAGLLAGGVTGMRQTWYVGPIARKFGGGGGDVGEFLTAGFTAFAYLVVRRGEAMLLGR